MSYRVLTIRTVVANCYAVLGERAVIVDTCGPGHAAKILTRLARHGFTPHQVSLILLTHGHLDHFGSALELRERTGAPIAMHALDAHAVRRGRNPPLNPLNFTARLMAPFLRQQVEPFEPDLLIDEGFRLDVFGIPGRVLFTPGHTPGSISVLLPEGELLAGDLLMGGYLGGHLAPRRPGWAYFADDLEQTGRGIAHVLREPVKKVYVGHGGPLDAEAIRKRFSTLAAPIRPNES